MSTSGMHVQCRGRGLAPVAGAAPAAGPAPPPLLPAEEKVEAKTESQESDMTWALVFVTDLFCNMFNKKLNSEKSNVRTVRLCTEMHVFKIPQEHFPVLMKRAMDAGTLNNIYMIQLK